MRTLFCLFTLIFAFSSVFGQTNDKISKELLIGIWQADSNEESAAWLESYSFDINNRFIFRTSQYDGLRKVISIMGNYRIDNNSIYFKADSITELNGVELERSKFQTLNDSWSFNNVSFKTVPVYSQDEFAEIESCNESENRIPCIMIDKRKFYRIKSNPNDY